MQGKTNKQVKDSIDFTFIALVGIVSVFAIMAITNLILAI